MYYSLVDRPSGLINFTYGEKNMGKRFFSKTWLAGLLMAVSLTGCGDDGGGNSNPNSAANAGATVVGAVSTESAAVPLGSAGNYAILAKTGVATVPTSAVTGNVGVSPAAKDFLTGWAQTDDVTNSYATSAQVVAPGKLYAANNTGGTTSADLTKAVIDMETAYNAALAKPAGVGPKLNLGGGTLTNQSLAAGVYTWGTAVTIPTDLTLTGSATDVWVFQVAGTLDMAAAKSVVLTGGALAKNVFWQASGAVTIGADTAFKGIVLGKTSITLGANTSIDGRLLAQSAVVLNATRVTVP